MPSRDTTASYLRQGSVALMGLTIALNITWPLVDGDLRDVVTISAIQTFAVASLLHAWGTQGSTYASRLASVVLLSAYAVTSYALLLSPLTFSPRLGIALGGVPLVVPLAWLMLMHPALELARRATSDRRLAAVIAGCTVGAANLYIEPQLGADGYLTFGTAVPTGGLVLLHTVAWCVALTAAAYAVLDIAGPGMAYSSVTMPLIALLWVWLGSFAANVVPVAPFLDQPGVAVQGFVGMGAVLAPAAFHARRRR